MTTQIKVKRSAVAGKVPTTTDLDLGELAINTYDGKLFIKKNENGTESVIDIGNVDAGSSQNIYKSITDGTNTASAASNTDSIRFRSTGGATVTIGSNDATYGDNVLIGLSNVPNSSLSNSSVTIGSTSLSLGSTASSLAGLTSVTSTSFIGALTGNASTATKWTTPRNITFSSGISGTTSFDGSSDISIVATVANDSHTHDTRYYTETEIGNFFAATSAIAGYNKSNWDTAYGWGNHAAQSYATQAYVGTQISNLVNSAPAALDTLNELATALGNDANFATTTSTALGNRLRVDTAAQNLTTTQQSNARTNLGLATVASSGSYTDLTNKPTTTSIGEGTNLYYTDARARAAISATTGSAAYNNSTGVITIPGTSSHITEGTNLFYTDARVRAALSFVAGSGAYNSATGAITIPTNTNQLTNGAGFVTSSGVTSIAAGSYLTGGTITSTGTIAVDATSANTASKVVARDANGDFAGRYINSSYFNSSDDVSAGTLTYLMGKFGDNYYRSATAAKVATFISGQSMNISGNATNITAYTINQNVGTSNSPRFEGLNIGGVTKKEYFSTSISAVTAVHTFAMATYGSAKYLFTITEGSNRKIIEIFASHNGTAVTDYAVVVATGTINTTYDVDVSSGNIRLVVTPSGTVSVRGEVTMIVV